MRALPVALALWAALTAAGCSKAPGAVGAASDAKVGGVDVAVGNTANACEKDLTAADVADLIGTTGVTTQTIPTNAEGCTFHGPGLHAVTVVVRSGDEVDPFWQMTINLNHEPMVPLAGIGDRALRLPDGSEVIARKGAFGCQVDIIGRDDMLARAAIGGSADVLAQRLGGLCAKVFAARHA